MFSNLLRIAEGIFILACTVIVLGAILLFSYEPPSPFNSRNVTVVPIVVLSPVDGGP